MCLAQADLLLNTMLPPSQPGPDLKSSSHYCATMAFDFRSQRFCEEANALVQMTGRSLVMCRQELFLAEGDVLQAQAVLCAGDALPAWSERLH